MKKPQPRMRIYTSPDLKKFEIRLLPSMHRAIKKAADSEGKTMSRFIVDSAMQKAERIKI